MCLSLKHLTEMSQLHNRTPHLWGGHCAAVRLPPGIPAHIQPGLTPRSTQGGSRRQQLWWPCPRWVTQLQAGPQRGPFPNMKAFGENPASRKSPCWSFKQMKILTRAHSPQDHLSLSKCVSFSLKTNIPRFKDSGWVKSHQQTECATASVATCCS